MQSPNLLTSRFNLFLNCSLAEWLCKIFSQYESPAFGQCCEVVSEPERVYRRVKYSKDEPYDEAEFHPAYPAELRERGVRLFRDHHSKYTSDIVAYRAIAPKLGCSPDSLRAWCQQAERDARLRAGLTSVKKDRIKALEREVRELS